MSKFNFNSTIQLFCVYRDKGLLLYAYFIITCSYLCNFGKLEIGLLTNVVKVHIYLNYV